MYAGSKGIVQKYEYKQKKFYTRHARSIHVSTSVSHLVLLSLPGTTPTLHTPLTFHELANSSKLFMEGAYKVGDFMSRAGVN